MINNKFFEHYEKLFNAHFELTREKYQHSGNKGSCNELILRDFISEFLPDKWKVGHGEVIDSENKSSNQSDIIVADAMTQPFIKNYDKYPNMFVIEAVSCIGEVKAQLTTLDDSFEKCRSFKLLSPKFSNGDIIHTNETDRARFYDKRPFFVFSFETKMTIENIISKLNDRYSNTSITAQIDAIFMLDKGAIINFGDGGGAFKYVDQKTCEPYEGFIKVCQENEVLQSLVTWMTAVMPNVHNFQNPIIHYLMKN